VSFSYNGFECYGVDFSKKMLEFAQQHCKKHDLKVNLKQADATELPFPKEHFDYVLSISMLHHLNEEERVMAVKEIRRVLKYEGKALITVWNKLQLRFLFERKDALIPWHIADKVYQRYYHLFMHGELKSLLKNEGFKIIKSNIFGKNLIFLVEK
jgi:putative AdoMet-dependent methyltransferase